MLTISDPNSVPVPGVKPTVPHSTFQVVTVPFSIQSKLAPVYEIEEATKFTGNGHLDLGAVISGGKSTTELRLKVPHGFKGLFPIVTVGGTVKVNETTGTQTPPFGAPEDCPIDSDASKAWF